ncbi:MAG TPA: GNAT family N-acetyltransferase [Parvularculaceae bacterium]|nr:GNAT family N-acetyltransferase [Parvularculaceae bacterium]
MASDIEIRPARIEDAEAIRSMIEGLAHETLGKHQNVLSADAVRRYGFGPEKSFDCFVADRNGEVVAAMIVFDEFSTWRGEKGVYVLDIYIAPAARGAGLGKRLIARAAEWGRMRGAHYVRLSVDQKNIHAINFYEAIGFKESAHDRVFLLSGDAFDEIGA